MHDDATPIILPSSIGTPEQAARRTREAEAILAEAGFAGARAEDRGQTLLIQIRSADLSRLQDEGLRERLVYRLRALGYAFTAVELNPGEPSP